MDTIIAVVAGATRGAGKGIALALAEAGATIYVVGRSTRSKPNPNMVGTIEDTVEEINAMGGRGIPYSCDCSDPDQVAALFQTVEQEQGQLHVLANAAWGGHDVEWDTSPFHQQAAKQWEYMFERSVKNYLLCSCAAVPLLQKTPGSLVVNISFWDDDKYTGHLYYDLSKQAMNRMSLGIAKELADQDVTSIALSPGYMRTERVEAALAADPSMAETFGVPTETTRYVGRAVTALLKDSDKQRWNGQSLRVGDLAPIYSFTDLDGSQPAAFKLP